MRAHKLQREKWNFFINIWRYFGVQANEWDMCICPVFDVVFCFWTELLSCEYCMLVGWLIDWMVGVFLLGVCAIVCAFDISLNLDSCSCWTPYFQQNFVTITTARTTTTTTLNKESKGNLLFTSSSSLHIQIHTKWFANTYFYIFFSTKDFKKICIKHITYTIFFHSCIRWINDDHHQTASAAAAQSPSSMVKELRMFGFLNSFYRWKNPVERQYWFHSVRFSFSVLQFMKTEREIKR